MRKSAGLEQAQASVDPGRVLRCERLDVCRQIEHPGVTGVQGEQLLCRLGHRRLRHTGARWLTRHRVRAEMVTETIIASTSELNPKATMTLVRTCFQAAFVRISAERPADMVEASTARVR